MKLRFVLAAAAVAALTVPVFSNLSMTPEGATVGAKIPAFMTQAIVNVDSQATKAVTAFFVIGTSCPATPHYAKRLKSLEDEYMGKGIEFVYIFPNKNESKEDKLAWHKKIGLRGAFVEDEGAKIAKGFGTTKTAEVTLIAKDGTVLYRGGIDDSVDEAAVTKPYLKAAIDEHLAGKPVTVTTSKPNG